MAITSFLYDGKKIEKTFNNQQLGNEELFNGLSYVATLINNVVLYMNIQPTLGILLSKTGINVFFTQCKDLNKKKSCVSKNQAK